jgi:hypothetical protein
MSAEDILDKWFGGPEGKSKNVNPRELLKELPPVSLGGRRDYATAIELGNKRGTKLELKYPSWGLYPRHELAELLTMIRIDFIKSLIVLNGDIAAQNPRYKCQKRKTKRSFHGKKLTRSL